MKTAKSSARPARAYIKRLERPKLWIVAGANGSGKSSVYQDTEIEDTSGAAWIINPDILTAQIQITEKLDLGSANIAAAERMFRWLQASIAAYQTIGVETVLSTDKYRPLVEEAQRKNFEIRLIYVVLKSAELNVERVALRVKSGGHDVPREKIIERRGKSLAQLPWFLARSDLALIYDNSGALPVEIVRKSGDTVEISPNALPEIGAAIEIARKLQKRS
ncbi:MAG: zeta toxin family protein [Proteobacteria bacterium]|nr:zeta toxin family protein [Pseudomonadota bacterium]